MLNRFRCFCSFLIRARHGYQHTPRWEYFDLHKNEPFTSWESSSYRVEMQAEPVKDWDGEGNAIPGTPYWASLEDITENDVLPNDFWETVIDAKCKVEDAERRARAQKQLASQTKKDDRAESLPSRTEQMLLLYAGLGLVIPLHVPFLLAFRLRGGGGLSLSKNRRSKDRGDAQGDDSCDRFHGGVPPFYSV
jgi:hypothetical protein